MRIRSALACLAATSARAGLLANAPYLNGYDVLVHSEMFDNGPSNSVKTGLSDRYPHQTPVLGRSTSGWDQTLGDFSWLTPEDGGVTILSKWPIGRLVQYVYDEGCGALGSHAQADDSLCGDRADAAAVRAAQFAELNAFLDAQDIPSSQQVIIAGDLNVVKSSPEYAEMLGLTGTVLTPQSPPWESGGAIFTDYSDHYPVAG